MSVGRSFVGRFDPNPRRRYLASEHPELSLDQNWELIRPRLPGRPFMYRHKQYFFYIRPFLLKRIKRLRRDTLYSTDRLYERLDIMEDGIEKHKIHKLLNELGWHYRKVMIKNGRRRTLWKFDTSGIIGPGQ